MIREIAILEHVTRAARSAFVRGVWLGLLCSVLASCGRSSPSDAAARIPGSDLRVEIEQRMDWDNGPYYTYKLSGKAGVINERTAFFPPESFDPGRVQVISPSGCRYALLVDSQKPTRVLIAVDVEGRMSGPYCAMDEALVQALDRTQLYVDEFNKCVTTGERYVFSED